MCYSLINFKSKARGFNLKLIKDRIDNIILGVNEESEFSFSESGSYGNSKLVILGEFICLYDRYKGSFLNVDSPDKIQAHFISILEYKIENLKDADDINEIHDIINLYESYENKVMKDGI